MTDLFTALDPMPIGKTIPEIQSNLIFPAGAIAEIVSDLSEARAEAGGQGTAAPKDESLTEVIAALADLKDRNNQAAEEERKTLID